MKLKIPMMIGMTLVVGGWLAWAQTQPAASNAAPAQASLGSPATAMAPQFALRGADNKTLRLKDLRGKGLLVAFLLTSAGPCQKQMPTLVDLQTKYGGANFSVLGLVLDEDGTNTVKAFAATHQVNFPLLFVDYETIEGFGGLTAVPTMVLVDPGHQIVKRHVGLVERGQLETEVQALLAR